MPRRDVAPGAEYAELRRQALAAHAIRMIHDCKLYGLLQGGPRANVQKCDRIIDRAARNGIVFSDEEVVETAVSFIDQINQGKV